MVYIVPKPGHIITTDENTDYSKTFPGWDVHVIQEPNNPLKFKYDRFKDKNGLQIRKNMVDTRKKKIESIQILLKLG